MVRGVGSVLDGEEAFGASGVSGGVGGRGPAQVDRPVGQREPWMRVEA